MADDPKDDDAELQAEGFFRRFLASDEAEWVDLTDLSNT